MTKVVIKPHHFLDIIKLYGSGLDNFIPAPDFEHDFYRVGNTILENPDVIIRLTIAGDDICKPCKYFDSMECTGDSNNNLKYPKKEVWNRIIDKRLFKKLNLKEGDELTALDFVFLIKKQIKKDDMLEVWREKIIPQRAPFLLRGLEKYLEKREEEVDDEDGVINANDPQDSGVGRGMLQEVLKASGGSQYLVLRTQEIVKKDLGMLIFPDL